MGSPGWQFEAHGLRTVLWATGGVLAFLYYAAPPLRVPLYLVWMAIFAPIGRWISIGLLGAIYFGVVTPTAMLMSLLGRDRLGRRFDGTRSSYWVSLESTARSSSDLDRYFRQT